MSTWCRTRSAYRVCAQAAMTLCTCNVTDRLLLLVNVTPRILIVCTRWSSGILSGIENFVFRLWSVKIISWLFVKLSFRLLASAHSLTLCNSWDCDYILLQSEKLFLVYCSGCRSHPDASLYHVDKQSKPAYVKYLHVKLNRTGQVLEFNVA